MGSPAGQAKNAIRLALAWRCWGADARGLQTLSPIAAYRRRFVRKGLLRRGQVGTFAGFYSDASINFLCLAAFVHP